MTYEINNQEVLTVENIQGKTKTHIVKKGYCRLYNTQINAENLLAITFKWLKFDVELGEHIEDTQNTTPFLVDVTGQAIEIQVGETLEFTSEETGTFVIKTVNELVANDSVEVVIGG